MTFCPTCGYVPEDECTACGRSASTLAIWTIYNSPLDFPGKVVARKFLLDQPTSEYIVRDSLVAIREAIPQGLYRIPRQDADEKHIVEMWL